MMGEYYTDASWSNNFDTSTANNNNFSSDTYSFYDTSEKGWNDYWNDYFQLDGNGANESTFWNSVKDYAASDGGQATISNIGSGVASGLLQYMAQNKSNDFSKSLSDQQLAWEREKFEATMAMAEKQLAVQEGALELEKSKFSDDVATRKAHNASINKSGKGSASKVTFG